MTNQANSTVQSNQENSFPQASDLKESIMPNYHVKKVKLDDYGFIEAGVNKGDASAMANFLNEIKEGHVVDVNQSEQELSNKRKIIEDAIDNKKNELITRQEAAKQLEEHTIPEKDAEIIEKKEEIKQLELEKFNGKTGSQNDSLMLWMWGILSVLLGIYLVMFYASAIHSVFFRDLLQELVKSGNTKNLSEKLNSIFDPNALFQPSLSLLYIYFGSTLFFALGLLAHHYLNLSMNPFKKMWITALALLIPFIADSLLALKIHNNIAMAKRLIGLEDNTPWHHSMNFWLVIVFGYVAYMAWALVFQLYHAERKNRNPLHTANFEIQGLKQEIKALRDEIREHRNDLTQIRINIEQFNQEIERLCKQLERALQDPDLLQHSLHQFFGGWLRYINAGNQEIQRKECTQLFDQFIHDTFKLHDDTQERLLTLKN